MVVVVVLSLVLERLWEEGFVGELLWRMRVSSIALNRCSWRDPYAAGNASLGLQRGRQNGFGGVLAAVGLSGASCKCTACWRGPGGGRQGSTQRACSPLAVAHHRNAPFQAERAPFLVSYCGPCDYTVCELLEISCSVSHRIMGMGLVKQSTQQDPFHSMGPMRTEKGH